MSAELVAIVSATLALAGLIVAAWRDVTRRIDRLADRMDADRRAHDAQHAAERADHAADMRELRAAIAGRGATDGAP